MSAHFLCLTAGGGIPLYSKTRNGLTQLPFPVAGSLNGVHMFANTHGVTLQSTTTPDSIITWKTYHDSLTLILVVGDDGAGDAHAPQQLLDYLFSAMVLLYGQDNLAAIKNLERFKREIKVCNLLIDYILDLLETPVLCEATQAVELITGPECLILQNYIDTFCEAAHSPYGCVYVGGRVAAATGKWWQLAAVELVLLRMLSACLPACSSRDLPVFLPVTSAQVPHRLLMFRLLQGVEVCVLCGPAPTLAELEREVDRFWRSSVDSLRSLKQNIPRLLSPDVVLDPNIYSVLVVNTETHRCMCSTNPPSSASPAPPRGSPHHAKNQQDDFKKKQIKTLNAFYKSVCRPLWPKAAASTDTSSDTSQDKDKDTGGGGDDVTVCANGMQGAEDVFVCADAHKCYAHTSGVRQIYIVTSLAVPTYALRSLAQDTLQRIVKDKSVLL